MFMGLTSHHGTDAQQFWLGKHMLPTSKYRTFVERVWTLFTYWHLSLLWAPNHYCSVKFLGPRVLGIGALNSYLR